MNDWLLVLVVTLLLASNTLSLFANRRLLKTLSVLIVANQSLYDELSAVLNRRGGAA